MPSRARLLTTLARNGLHPLRAFHFRRACQKTLDYGPTEGTGVS